MKQTLSTSLIALSLLALSACAVKSNVASRADQAAKSGAFSLERVEGNSEEAAYKWHYPQHPAEYKVEPLNREYMSGRELGPLGSYAGPWIEGADAELLPVANPNINVGRLVLEDIKASNPSWNVQYNIIEESPFQVFLKVRKALEGLNIQSSRLGDKVAKPVEKERIWSATMALYVAQQPDWKVTVPVRLSPADKKNGSLTFGNCNMCHGADGWGAGHSGLTLQPHPANFHQIQRMYNRSEGKLYEVLRNGVYGSAMPQWNDKLSEAEIKSVVAYVRSFSYSVEQPKALVAAGGGQ